MPLTLIARMVRPSFLNSWTGSLVSVSHPTLHRTQALLLLSLKKAEKDLEELFSASVRKAPTLFLISGSDPTSSLFQCQARPLLPQTLPLLSRGKPHLLFLL